MEDLEGKILLANPVLCSLPEYPEDELCGMHCSDFANPQDSEDDWSSFNSFVRVPSTGTRWKSAM